MPVYGLPTALESSLNSLIDLQPPTSWRVSGHGNDITVVLRWSLCSSSPSSDKTFAYDIGQNKVTTAGNIKHHIWKHHHKTPYLSPPRADHYKQERNRCQKRPESPTKVETGIQMYGPSKVETMSSNSDQRSSPIPLFISTSSSIFSSTPKDCRQERRFHSSPADAIDESSHRELNDHSEPTPTTTPTRVREDQGELQGIIQYAATDGGSFHEIESDLRRGIRAYLTQNDSALSSHTFLGRGIDISTIKNVDDSHLKLNASNSIDSATHGAHISGNSDCASDSGVVAPLTKELLLKSTSSGSSCVTYEIQTASGEVAHENNDTKNSEAELPTPYCQTGNVCSSATDSPDCSSFDIVTATPGEQSESPSNDLDMACSAGSEQFYDYNSSDRNSMSYWDSFDHLQDSVASDITNGGGIG